MINPAIAMVSGSGKPRLILVQATNFYASSGVTSFTSTTMSEAEGATTAITSSSAANPTNILTATPHGKVIGDYIRIAGHSIGAMNAKWLVIDVPDTTHLKIGYNSAGGTGGTLQKTPAFASRGLSVRRRLFVPPAGATANPARYAKITAIDDTNNILTVDSWIGGTPNAADPILVNGWIADLPYCNGRANTLTESFDPEVNVIGLWRYIKKAKHYGFNYACILDYSEYMSGDTLLSLAPHLSMKSDERLILIPRVDTPAFSYNVYLSDKIDVAQFGRTLAHKKIAFRFVGKELVAGFPMSGGYGTNYSNNFGIGL